MGKNKSYQKRFYKEDNKQAKSLAKENLKAIGKPRKPVNQSFIANYEGQECPKCFVSISKGERVRYNDEGLLIHTSHQQKEPTYTFCDKCFLTLPCECEES